MKKVLTLLVMSLFLFSFASVGVLAQEDSETISDEDLDFAEGEEITDPSGIAFDKFRRAFTFNKQRKAEISEKIAQKRVIRSAKLIEEGKFDKAKIEAGEHGKELEEARKHFDEIAQEGNEEEVKRALKRIILAQNRFELHNERVDKRHQEILEKKADTMTDEQLVHLEEVFDKINTKTDEVGDRLEQTKTNLIARYKIVTGMTDEEIEEVLSKYEKFLEGKREMRKNSFDIRKERKDLHRDQIRKRHQMKDFEMTDERREMIKDRLKESGESEEALEDSSDDASEDDSEDEEDDGDSEDEEDDLEDSQDSE